MTGTIKMKRGDKGFGFIRSDDGEEYFFHANGVSRHTSFEALQAGDRVEGEIILDTRSGKMRAVHISVL